MAKNPPGKSPAKSSKFSTTNITDTFLQMGPGPGQHIGEYASFLKSQERKRHININKFFRRLPGWGGFSRPGGQGSPNRLPGVKSLCAVCGTQGIQVRKNSPNIKFLGGIFLGHPGPRRRDIPDKNFMQVAFFCCFRQGVAGMSRDLGRDVPDLEKLYARKLWADFSHPRNMNIFVRVPGRDDDSFSQYCVCESRCWPRPLMGLARRGAANWIVHMERSCKL